MSSTVLFKVSKSTGDVGSCVEFRNSWRGAAFVWTSLGKRYLNGASFIHEGEGKKIWALWNSTIVPVKEHERVTLLTTFDRFILRREYFFFIAACFRKFAQTHGDCSLTEQGEVLEQWASDPDCLGACWQQTTVADNPWWIDFNPDVPAEDQDVDDEGRCYNINKDTGHYFLEGSLLEVRAACELTGVPITESAYTAIEATPAGEQPLQSESVPADNTTESAC